MVGGLFARWRNHRLTRTHRICEGCGMSAAEIDRVIDHCAHSILDRKGQLDLHRSFFDQGQPDTYSKHTS